MRDAIEKGAGVFGGTDNSVFRGTEMERLARGRYVACGSSLYNSAYSMFRENLEDLKEYCRSAHVPVILGTQVSNLRDQPPFISNNSPELNIQQKNSVFTVVQERFGVSIEKRFGFSRRPLSVSHRFGFSLRRCSLSLCPMS